MFIATFSTDPAGPSNVAGAVTVEKTDKEKFIDILDFYKKIYDVWLLSLDELNQVVSCFKEISIKFIKLKEILRERGLQQTEGLMFTIERGQEVIEKGYLSISSFIEEMEDEDSKLEKLESKDQEVYQIFRENYLEVISIMQSRLKEGKQVKESFSKKKSELKKTNEDAFQEIEGRTHQPFEKIKETFSMLDNSTIEGFEKKAEEMKQEIATAKAQVQSYIKRVQKMKEELTTEEAGTSQT